MIRALLCIFLFLLSPTILDAAGRQRSGTAAAPELLIPVGARALALGGATLATTSGIESLYWNPAGLVRTRTRADMLFSTTSYLADIRVNYAAVSSSFQDLGALALSLKTLSFGDIPITTEKAPDGTGAFFAPTFFTLAATYARSLTDRIAVGGTAHYIVERIERIAATGLSFDMGLQYADLGDVSGLHLGVALKHIGSRMQFDGPALLRSGQLEGLRRPGATYKVASSAADLPSIFEIGLAYRRPRDSKGLLELAAVFRHRNFARDQWKVGAEYSYNPFFKLRGGFDYVAAAGDDYLFGTSFGFGLQLRRDMHVDYAYTTVDFFDGLNTFTLRLDF